MKKSIHICTALRCRQNHSEELLNQAKEALADSDIMVDKCGCLGGCQFGPNMKINDGKKNEVQHTVTTSFLKKCIDLLKNS